MRLLIKPAICHSSCYHGNTLNVLRAITQKGEVDLTDITTHQSLPLEEYDCIGFAGGICYGKFQREVLQFAQQHLPHRISSK